MISFLLSENRDISQQAHKLEAFDLPLLVQNHPENPFCLKYFMTMTYFLILCNKIIGHKKQMPGRRMCQVFLARAQKVRSMHF